MEQVGQEEQEAIVLERALRVVADKVCSYDRGEGLLQLLRLPKRANAVVLAPNTQRLDCIYNDACFKASPFIAAASQTRHNFLIKDGAMVWFKVADMAQLAELRFDVAMLAE